MDKYTIFDQAGPATAVAPARDLESLADTARRDLEAALQLLAERAQYLTGASGASIALREDGAMVCRASAGRAAPEVGVEIETHSGLTAESIRTCQMVCCDNAENDPRVNRESCLELDVRSVMVMPLVRDSEVVGLFELVADPALAFEERDKAILMRLAEVVLTAVEHADATQRALPEMSEVEGGEGPGEAASAAVEPAKSTQIEEVSTSLLAEPPAPVSVEIAQIGSCEECGFPVSQGRKLCVDCEQAGRSAEGKPAVGEVSGFSHLNVMGQEESWFQAHSYTLGALFIAALTLALLALKLR